MKRQFLLMRMLLLFALIVGSGSSVWAEDATITLTQSALGLGSYTSNTEKTIDGITFVYTDLMKNNDNIQAKASTGVIYNKTAFPTNIKSVAITHSGTARATTISGSADGKNWTQVTTGNGSITGNFSNMGFKYFKITRGSYAAYWTQIVITYEVYDANKVVTPTISISTTTPFVSSKAVTIESETEGASIYYTTDGSTTPTRSSTLYDPSNKPVINATTTIKAIAVKEGMTDSDVATRTITKETVLNGISALNSATTSNTATPHYVKLTDAQITYVEANGNYGFLNDANAGIYLYVSDLVLNTKYNGIYRITSKTYHSWKEVTAFEEIDGEGSSEVAEPVDPIEMTASDLEANFSTNINRQIKIKNHTTTAQNKLTENISLNTTYYGKNIAAGTYTFIGYPDVYDSSNRFRVVSVYPKPAVPTFDPIEGEFSEAFTLHLSCATDGTTIYYTTNGDDPTTSSNVYNDATGISIPAATTTVKAIAYYEDMTSDVASATYDYRVVAKPQFSPVDGSAIYYGAGGGVTITCATDGATIYYTTNGDTPTTSSSVYSSPISITDATTIKTMAKLGDDESSVVTASYTIKTPDAPVFSVEQGAVARNTVVNISSREGTTIYYTVDGSDPDGADDSGVNSVNITVTDDMTIRAICIDGAANISSETSAEYTIAKVAKPVFSVAAGMVSKGTQLTITTATEGAVIYYTLDGTEPTSSSNVYSGYIQINGAHTVKAIAIKENYIDSEVMSAAYSVAGAGESIVFQNIYGETDTDLSTVDGANATLTFTEGTTNAPKYYKSDHTARLYNGGSLTISSTMNIIRIEYGISSGYSKDSGTSGTLTSGVWTGKSKSVKINASATCKFSTISIFYELTDEDATIGDSKFAGFCSEYKVDFSETGLKVYKAKVDEGNVKLTEITDGIVPANTGVILNGDADDYEIPFTDASATADFSDNQMVGVTQRTQVLWNPTTGVYNYILQQGEFNKATDGYLKPNRAYLSTSYNIETAGSRSMKIVFDDSETTGVQELKNSSTDELKSYYNLNGQRVVNPSKGLYIVNGKKVIIK